MAMTQLTVLWLMTVALLLSGGLLRDFEDAATSVLLGFISSVFWGLAGIGAFSVHTQAWPGSKSMDLLAIVGIGMALLVAALSLHELAVAIRRTSGTTEQAVID